MLLSALHSQDLALNSWQACIVAPSVNLVLKVWVDDTVSRGRSLPLPFIEVPLEKALLGQFIPLHWGSGEYYLDFSGHGVFPSKPGGTRCLSVLFEPCSKKIPIYFLWSHVGVNMS